MSDDMGMPTARDTPFHCPEPTSLHLRQRDVGRHCQGPAHSWAGPLLSHQLPHGSAEPLRKRARERLTEV